MRHLRRVYAHRHRAGEIGLTAPPTAPICETDASQSNGTAVIPYITAANTNIFLTQLLNSFASSIPTLLYLCEHLQPVLLDNVLVSGTLIRSKICVCAGYDAPGLPTPDGPSPVPSAGVQSAYLDTASTLFAYEYALSATSDPALAEMCEQTSYMSRNLAYEGLNTQLIETLICNLTTPLSTEDGMDLIQRYSTGLFLQSISTMASSDDWEEWLCENLDVEAMDGIALDGASVQNTVCGGAE